LVCTVKATRCAKRGQHRASKHALHVSIHSLQPCGTSLGLVRTATASSDAVPSDSEDPPASAATAPVADVEPQPVQSHAMVLPIKSISSAVLSHRMLAIAARYSPLPANGPGRLVHRPLLASRRMTGHCTIEDLLLMTLAHHGASGSYELSLRQITCMSIPSSVGCIFRMSRAVAKRWLGSPTDAFCVPFAWLSGDRCKAEA
jgi:hypothetical protein